MNINSTVITPLSTESPSSTTLSPSGIKDGISNNSVNSISPSTLLSQSQQIIQNRKHITKVLDTLNMLSRMRSQNTQGAKDQLRERCATCHGQILKRKRLLLSGNINKTDVEMPGWAKAYIAGNPTKAADLLHASFINDAAKKSKMSATTPAVPF